MPDTEEKNNRLYQRVLRRLAVPLAETVSHTIRARIDDMERTIQETQLGINHHQYYMLEEISQRVKNSGTLVLSDREMITKIFSGLVMYLDPQDMAIAVHIALDGIWEHRVTIAWM